MKRAVSVRMLYLDDFRELWVINGLCDVLINHLRFSLSPLGAMMKLVVLIHGCEWFTVSIERNDVDVDGVFCGSIGCDYHVILPSVPSRWRRVLGVLRQRL